MLIGLVENNRDIMGFGHEDLTMVKIQRDNSKYSDPDSAPVTPPETSPNQKWQRRTEKLKKQSKGAKNLEKNLRKSPPVGLIYKTKVLENGQGLNRNVKKVDDLKPRTSFNPFDDLFDSPQTAQQPSRHRDTFLSQSYAPVPKIHSFSPNTANQAKRNKNRLAQSTVDNIRLNFERAGSASPSPTPRDLRTSTGAFASGQIGSSARVERASLNPFDYDSEEEEDGGEEAVIRSGKEAIDLGLFGAGRFGELASAENGGLNGVNGGGGGQQGAVALMAGRFEKQRFSVPGNVVSGVSNPFD